MSARYTGWLKEARGGWIAVAEGDSIAACHRNLISALRRQARVPVATAILPAGAHPGDQDGTASRPAVTDRAEASRGGRKPARPRST
jgi:hypothetical protein